MGGDGIEEISSAAALKERKKKAQQREKAYAKKWPELEAVALYKSMFQSAFAAKGQPSGENDADAEILSIPKPILIETNAYLKKESLRKKISRPYFTCTHESMSLTAS